MDIVEDFKKYLSGWFDGDGCIMVEKQNGGYALRIKLSQSDENWIDTILKFYPFLKKSGSIRGNKQRTEYELRASGLQIEPLVDDLLKYTILKYEQLTVAKSFFKFINKLNTFEDKEALYKKLKNLKETNSSRTMKIPYERLNTQYIAGFFDAEGCITVQDGLRVKITQKSDETILKEIAKLYNNKNKINNYALCFYSFDACHMFLNDIKDYCIYKTPQINACIEYIKLKSKKTHTEDDNILIQKCIDTIKSEKQITTVDEQHILNTQNNVFVKQIDVILKKNEQETILIEQQKANEKNLANVQLIQNKIDKLSTDTLLEIIDYKSDDITSEEVSKIIKNKYNITISRNIISKIWKADSSIKISDDIKNTENYKKMIGNVKQRTYNRKFTKEEQEFIKNIDKTNTYDTMKLIFEKKYNKTITKEHIANLIKK